MPIKERLLLITKYSNSLVEFRQNIEGLSTGDDLGRKVYLLAIMLGSYEESEYTSPNPDVEHLTWVFHQSSRLLINTIMQNPDKGVTQAFGVFIKLRDELLKK